MKDPWEVYYELFTEQAQGVVITQLPLAEGSEESKALGAAFAKAHESTLHHLVEERRWEARRARELVDEFFDEAMAWVRGPEAGDFPRLKERIRHRNTGWALRKQNRG